MIMIDKKPYADNFPKRAQALKELTNWKCEQCGRKHGEEYKSNVIQLPLLKTRKRKHKKKRIVLNAHHPNYDTINPEAELIILCRACHGKAQKQHNREVNQKNAEAKKLQQAIDETEKRKRDGQLMFSFAQEEYPVMHLDFPITAFLQAIPLVQ